MKEAIVSPELKVKIIDSPVPKPGPDDVLIKVFVSGSNPKDWKWPQNPGDDIAGIVEEVGENVYEFQKGDRVAAFHEMMTPHGSYAEYAISHAHTTFHIPKKTTFEEAATIPLAAMTAAIGMYLRLRLPEPWYPALEPLPLIIYGASGAVGSFAIKLAQASNIHPIIAVAGAGSNYVETLLSRDRGDTIVDYRNGNDACVAGLKDALKRAGVSSVHYAFDSISEHNSYQNICEVMPKGLIALTIQATQHLEIPTSVERTFISVGSVHGTPADLPAGSPGLMTSPRDFGFSFFRLFGRGLQQGWFSPHPHKVIPGGLGGLEEGLRRLKSGEASATKFVYKLVP